MGTVHCLKHPDYDGKGVPVLACKVCCSIYIRDIKEHQKVESDEKFNAYKWLAEKTTSTKSST